MRFCLTAKSFRRRGGARARRTAVRVAVRPAAALAGFLSIALSSGWLDGLRLRPALDAGRPGMDGLP